MNALDRANQFLADAVSQMNAGGSVTVVASSGGGWRAAALLGMSAAALGVSEAHAGAVQDGRLLIKDVSGFLQDVSRVQRGVESVGRSSDRGRWADALNQSARVLQTVEKYEPKTPEKDNGAPSSTDDFFMGDR